jgi:hypothetical protein
MIDKQVIHNWYSHAIVLFNMFNVAKNREVSFRVFKNDKSFWLRSFWFKSVGVSWSFFNERVFKTQTYSNIYMSIATLNFEGLTFASDFKKLAEFRKGFNKQFSARTVSINGYFDVDFNADAGFSMHDVVMDMEQLISLLEARGLQFNVVFSGSHGFHVYLPPYFNDVSKDLRFFGDLINEMEKEGVSISKKSHGINKIYNLRRITKIPYSLDVSSGLVVLPITKQQFNHCSSNGWNFDYFKPENVQKNVFLKNRGLVKWT